MTASEIRYLLILDKLSQKNEVIMPSKVADTLNFSRSSISRMINKFCLISLITRQKDRTIRISEKGVEKAQELKLIIDFVTKQLNEKLDSPICYARKEAVSIVGSLSKRTYEKLYVLAKKNDIYYKN